MTVFGSLSHFHLLWAEQGLCLGDGLSSKESVLVCVLGLQGTDIKLGQSDYPLFLVCLHPRLDRPFSPSLVNSLFWDLGIMIVPLLLFCSLAELSHSVVSLGLVHTLGECSHTAKEFKLGSGVASPGAPFVLSDLKAQGRLLLCFAILSRPALPSVCSHDAARLDPPIWLLP